MVYIQLLDLLTLLKVVCYVIPLQFTMPMLSKDIFNSERKNTQKNENKIGAQYLCCS